MSAADGRVNQRCPYESCDHQPELDSMSVEKAKKASQYNPTENKDFGRWAESAARRLGAEYRDKPNNLNALREDSAQDVFLAWGPVKNLTVTAAWTDLGHIAGKSAQSGFYASLWVGI